MADAQAALAQVREALAAGPTPGPWYHCQPFQSVRAERTIHGPVPAQRVDFVSTKTQPVHERIIIPMAGREAHVRSEDMAFIAACNPENIAALLAHVDAQAAEIERLRQWEIAGREWLDKTDWMQSNDAPARWLGRHRADCLREEIERLRAERDSIAIENSKLIDQIERLTAERDETMAKLANLFVAFNDWKVFHSTTRLEVELQLKAAERDELRRQLDEARAEREAMANVLPGVYYMDPPDGGDVSLLKQLQRMSNDAARYRLLRRKFAIISDGEGNAEFCPINLPRPTYIAPNTAIELDTALDRERLGLDGAKRPPTPVGWSDTDWSKHLQEQAEQPHPLAGQHINQGSMDAAADAYEAEYYDALKRDAGRYRWLRGGANIPPESTRWARWEVRHWDGRHWNTLFAEQMDAAIDAAMGGGDAG